ncbi:hypothetical protein [Streptomyces sp. NPDC001889]
MSNPLEVGDPSVLRNHPGLRRLTLFTNGPTREASTIGELKELDWLKPSHFDGLDPNTLRLLPKLRFTQFTDPSHDADLSPLTRITHLI